MTEIAPPPLVASDDGPADINISPPRPTFPSPADTTAEPALPAVAAPVVIEMRPPAPEVVDPVENFIAPGTPGLPASVVFKSMEPEDFGTLAPDENDIEPPVLVPDAPAL
jgi:hypothetical protein